MIIDDIPNSFHYQKENGLLVKPFYGKKDKILKKIGKFLIKNKDIHDIRHVIKIINNFIN